MSTIVHDCFHLMYIQQLVFLFSPPFDGRNPLPLVMAILYEILINIPVAGLQFPYQRTFGYFPVAEQTVWSHLVSQTRDQKLSKPKYYPNLTFYCIEYQ